jgi:hypothetical protein
VQLKVGLALIHTRLQPGAAGLETRISFNRFNGFPQRHCGPGRLKQTLETVETVRRIPDASLSTRLKPGENESRPTFNCTPFVPRFFIFFIFHLSFIIMGNVR